MVRTALHPHGPTERVWLDTRDPFFAGLLGYDGPVNPREDSDGLIVIGVPPTLTNEARVSIEGPEGEVTLLGRTTIEETALALLKTLDPALGAKVRELMAVTQRRAA